MITLVVDRFTRAAFVVVNLTVTPPAWAGAESVTGNGACAPNPTVTSAGRISVPRFTPVITCDAEP